MTSQNEDSNPLENGDLVTPPQRPHTIYLYYLTFNETGVDAIRAYKYLDRVNPIQNMKQKIEEVIQDIIDGNIGEHLEYRGDSFGDLQRTHKGYFVIALDGGVFALSDPPGPADYVRFECVEASVPTSAEHNKGKHTFHFRKQYNETISGKPISYVSYLYSAKSYDHGEDLLDRESESYDISFRVKLPERIDDILFEDSGGTNMGPPPRPPGFIGSATTRDA